MSRAELFIAGGAALILLTDLVFGIFGDYGFSNVIWAAAAVALILILANGRMAGMSLSAGTYRTILLVTVGVALLAGVRNLLLDILFIPGRNLDVTYFLGAVGVYVGMALLAVGGWQLWSRRTG